MRGLGILAALLCAGCANFHSSHVMIGQPRPAVDPAEVKIYLNPPARHEEIAMVTADSRGSFRWSSQGTTNLALQRLRKEAAALGANGLLNLRLGEPWGATSVVGTGIGYGWGGYPAGYALGANIGVPVPVKSATALAIRVPGS
jgi:hypothetical protein